VNYIPIASRKLYLEMRQVTLQKPGPWHILSRLVSGKIYGLIINLKPRGNLTSWNLAGLYSDSIWGSNDAT